MLDSSCFSVDVFRAAPEVARRQVLQQLESILNARLAGCTTLSEFQERLYAVIEELDSLGHVLGRWEYDCEIEVWGGHSYMDGTLLYGLLLKSEYPHGVRLNWGQPSFEGWEQM